MSLGSFVAHRIHLPDDTLALALEGYAFIGNRCRALGTDVFETRIMLQRTICMLGADAARLFYDGDHLQREGATPLRMQATLFGRGGMQSLDGEPHRSRKQLMMSVLASDSVARLVSAFEDELLKAVTRLTPRIVLFDETEEVLARVTCAWAGVQIDDERRVRDIVAMIEGSGGAGPRNWRGRVGRARAEWWIERQIEDARKADISPSTALGLFARSHLDAHAAAVELLDLIRPTIAVARYIVFAAHALHEYPHAAEPLRDDAYLEPFVNEVRRFYPFFPAAVARVRRTFTWHKVEFQEGERVMLDLFGTNHDPALWPEPEAFRPQRFVGRQVDPYTLIPQGGGDLATGHRCPGERLTIELMKAALRVLTRRITYEVPPQDLSISLTRIPALPASRFVMTNVRWNGG